jgi:hypothetical protein
MIEATTLAISPEVTEGIAQHPAQSEAVGIGRVDFDLLRVQLARKTGISWPATYRDRRPAPSVLHIIGSARR